MTDDWLTSNERSHLFTMVWDRITERKLRLFCCGKTRKFWEHLIDPRSRAAIETAEAYADRLATPEELAFAAEEAQQAATDLEYALHETVTAPRSSRTPNASIADELFQQARVASYARTAVRTYPYHLLQRTENDEHSAEQAAILRDIFPNPFRPVSLNPAWLHWRDGTISRLASSIYTTRDFASLPILADALEEAGCTDTELLAHCRLPGLHTRGCWALDLLLGKDGTRQARTQILRHQRPQKFWTVRDPVEVNGRYLRQAGGRGHFAHLAIRFEPTNDAEAITLVNDIDEERIDASDRSTLPHYIRGISYGVYARLDELEKEGRPIAGLRLVLSDIRIHPVDSSQFAFRLAAHHAMEQGLAPGNLVRITEALL